VQFALSYRSLRLYSFASRCQREAEHLVDRGSRIQVGDRLDQRVVARRRNRQAGQDPPQLAPRGVAAALHCNVLQWCRRCSPCQPS
jgi:hypothetical protein